VRGELPAAERLRRLLETAYGDAWSPALLDRLLAEAGFAGKILAEWLDARTGFFQQHVKLFQNRPFIWQIHDGERGGFSALINYHTLTPEKLDRLIHSYLREWIEQQRTLASQGQTGADRRLAAAEQLRDKLLLIQEGEPPYDIYVRWKPLDRQPIGWEPDLNDGVRLNIRPFISAGILRAPVNVKWGKDRGANPPGSDAQRWAEEAQRAAVNNKELSSTNGSERLNELHLTNAVKRVAR
jgi:hypothetical protein